MPKFRECEETKEMDNYEATSRAGSKRNEKGKRKGKAMTTKPSSNDITWHASDDQLLKDAASIAFAYPSGQETYIDGKEIKLPGIATLDIYPSVGLAQTPADPINIAAQKAYSFVRHANSGHSNYDAPDLMTYLLAATTLYSEIFWAQRMYAWAFTYSQRNEYIGKAMLQAMGVDADEFIHHLADFRADLNVAISKISSFAVPKTMPIFQWMAFLYKDVYIDGPSVKDQLYLYRPGAFFDFDYDAQEKAVGLILKTIDYSKPLTHEDVIQIINDSVDMMISMEDFGIMGGDILKAYGSEGLIGVTYVPEMLVGSVLFDETVLHQFKNATIMKYTDLFNGSVRQDPDNNALIGQTYKVVQDNDPNIDAYKALARDKVLTVDLEAPTPGDVMEVTRLMASATVVPQTSGKLYTLIAGTAVAGALNIWVYTGSGTSRSLAHATYTGVTAMSASAYCLISRFKYLPAIWVYNTGGSADNAELLFDIDNFVLFTAKDVLKVHRAATLHEYHVDSVAMVTKAQ